MRNFLSNTLKNGYFLHADMWGNRFQMDKSIKVIDFGLAEQTLINAAGGLYLNDENVYIYGVAGFLIHQMEQIKYTLNEIINLYPNKKGKIIIFNAGKIGYEDFKNPHKLVDDIDLMNHYGIKIYDPNTINELKEILEEINQKNLKISYIRLGKDE